MKASIGVMIVLLAAAPALAQPPDATSPTAVDSMVSEPAKIAAPGSVLVAQEMVEAESTETESDGALSLEELGELRGGETIVIQHTTQTFAATNTGNSITGDTIGSGAVSLASNAFNGYDGIGNFVINTGHNNNLQGSISVSIAMMPQ